MKSTPKMLALTAGLSLFAASSVLADVGQDLKQAAEKVQTKAFELVDKDIISVGFEAGSAIVTASEKMTIRSVVQSVRNDDKVDRIIVAAWSDNHYPDANQKELSKKDRELAEKRAKNIKQALVELGVSKIDTYSMAERPNWIAKAFQTSDAKIKKSMRGQKVQDAQASAIADTLKDKGGPSKAVVIVKRVNSFTAH